jgi:hypothetical protein
MGIDLDGRRRGRAFAALICSCLLAAAGCASSGSPEASVGAPSTGSTSGTVALASNPDVLTGDELRATGTGNVWEAVRRLRPTWLRARSGAASVVSPQGTTPVVYVAGIRHGDLRTLQTMNVDQVRRVEFINARDATTRFGTGVGGGVILVDLDRE